ncbi:hypothetical protein ISP15_01030 [Dyella jejuensis]|uniref:Uncharacterized protein n=1 Tax=Dyella jejuensis TaxID=1432009 RepID=A0ABW8JCV9_9GAMM
MRLLQISPDVIDAALSDSQSGDPLYLIGRIIERINRPCAAMKKPIGRASVKM